MYHDVNDVFTLISYQEPVLFIEGYCNYLINQMNYHPASFARLLLILSVTDFISYWVHLPPLDWLKSCR